VSAAADVSAIKLEKKMQQTDRRTWLLLYSYCYRCSEHNNWLCKTYSA